MHRTILSAEVLKKYSKNSPNFFKIFFASFFLEKCMKYQNHFSEYFGQEYLETILKLYIIFYVYYLHSF